VNVGKSLHKLVIGAQKEKSYTHVFSWILTMIWLIYSLVMLSVLKQPTAWAASLCSIG